MLKNNRIPLASTRFLASDLPLVTLYDDIPCLLVWKPSKYQRKSCNNIFYSIWAQHEFPCQKCMCVKLCKPFALRVLNYIWFISSYIIENWRWCFFMTNTTLLNSGCKAFFLGCTKFLKKKLPGARAILCRLV